MPIVRVLTDMHELIGEVTIDSHHGPWSDEWQCGGESEFATLMNEAAQREGGE